MTFCVTPGSRSASATFSAPFPASVRPDPRSPGKANSMTIERIGVGPRMSQAVVHGHTVYLAGQVANKAAGQSVTEQTKEILETIDQLLNQAGADKTRILSATIYLADIKTFAEMNAVWDAWVQQGHTPARATVEAKLAAAPYHVEIACIAAK